MLTPSVRTSVSAMIVALGYSVACTKVDPRLLGATEPKVATNQPPSLSAAEARQPIQPSSTTPETPSTASTNTSNPAKHADLDSARWKSLLEGIADPLAVDLTLLASAMALDADVQVEFRPVVLTRAGLWLPILKALPREARAVYQESVLDAFDSDPMSRVESLCLSVKYKRDDSKKRTKEIAALNLFARTRAGVVRDFVRWAGKQEAALEKKSESESTFVLLEAMTEEDFAAVKSGTKVVEGTEMIDLGPYTTIAIERVAPNSLSTNERIAGIQLLTRGGIVGTTKSFDTLGAGVDFLIRVLRRANESVVQDSDGKDDLLASGRLSTSAEDSGSAEFEATLEKQLTIRGTYRPPSVVDVNTVASDLRDPKQAEKSLRKVRTVLPRTAEAIATTARYTVEGSAVRFELTVPVLDILADLGGASVSMPGQALRLGSGFDDSSIAGVASVAAPKRGVSDFSVQNGVAGQLQFLGAQNPRNEILKQWLEREGNLRNFVEWTGAHFGRPIPVYAAECGQANAFYMPDQRAIVICYELADDMIAKLRGIFKPDELGAAVLGGMLFILIHEYGHALIHQLQIPATGREEDAVDQLATVSLIGTGTKGILYAITAMRWFDASEKIGGRVPYWDEHSAHGVRAHEIACLIYGSDPQHLSAFAGSQWLPTQRARRCPSEYQKANSAWGALLGTRRGQDISLGSDWAGIGSSESESLPKQSECSEVSGQWELTTTVTSALNGGIGTHGYYRMRIAEDCNATFEKLGFDAIRFTPDRIQRGGTRLRHLNDRWSAALALQRDAATDYTMEFSFTIGDRVGGGWQYTGDSYRATGFAGTVEGNRL